ncbi:MAG: hypothetical protein ABI821_12935 [Pseudomonadota bacterium]
MATPAFHIWLSCVLALGIALPLGAQTPTKSKTPAVRTDLRIVSDEVRREGGAIVGGWREYGTDGSWRRAVFTLESDSGSVVFGDGAVGRRPPGVTRYSWSGKGRKDASVDFSETRAFGGAAPALLERARRSSAIPADIASRVRVLGGDIRLLRRLADISQRMNDIGKGFDAAIGPRPQTGVGTGLPGSDTRGREGNWADPRGGLDRNGVASDKPTAPNTSPRTPDEVVSTDGRTGTDGSAEVTVVVRHGDGSTTTHHIWTDDSGSGYDRTEREAKGNITGGLAITNRGSGESEVMTFQRNVNSGQIEFTTTTANSEGTRTITGRRGTPPETGGRRGYEVEMAQYVPWLAKANYLQWKRESDLLRSGGRISQPGGQPSLVLNEGPEVGVDGVINCGDANTLPCARNGGIGVDPRGSVGTISQPSRGVPNTPVPGKAPRPVPQPKPQ